MFNLLTIILSIILFVILRRRINYYRIYFQEESKWRSLGNHIQEKWKNVQTNRKWGFIQSYEVVDSDLKIEIMRYVEELPHKPPQELVLHFLQTIISSRVVF